jgi:hypothetical protein
MQWDFTPAQIVKGEAGYGLEEFRRDLAREVAMNFGNAGAADFARVYDLIYDQCYGLATGRPRVTLLAAFEHDPATRDWLAGMAPHLRENADMLGAILQREIMDCVAQGDPLEEALRGVAARHDELMRARTSACSR